MLTLSWKEDTNPFPQFWLKFISLLAESHSLFDIAIIVQSPRCVWLFATPWTAAHQASLPLIISRSLPKFMSIASMMLFDILWLKSWDTSLAGINTSYMLGGEGRKKYSWWMKIQILPSIPSLSSSSTFPSHNSLPWGINQSFTPEGYKPLAVLL